MKSLGHDCGRRSQQLAALRGHRRATAADRQVYWACRAEGWLCPTVLCIIVDGMDQGRFAYPRTAWMKSKDFETLQRPRLHVTGVLAHGHALHVSVSRGDFTKTTIV